MEIWKDVVGFEGLYQISSLGNIRSLNYSRTKTVKNIKPTLTHGYLRVVLRKDKKSFTRAVHRLVAEAFIDNFDNLPEVNHKDECKTNNCLDNLEWCTRKYNLSYGTTKERRRATWINNHEQGKHKLKPFFNGGNRGDKRKPVVQLSIDGLIVKEWDSAKSTKDENFDPGSVTKCCLNKRKTHKGFIWKYKD